MRNNLTYSIPPPLSIAMGKKLYRFYTATWTINLVVTIGVLLHSQTLGFPKWICTTVDACLAIGFTVSLMTGRDVRLLGHVVRMQDRREAQE